MSDRSEDQRQRALVHARCALGIVHAQYWRALKRASSADPLERARAIAEARRLLGVAVALSRRACAPQAEEITGAGPPKREGLRRNGAGPQTASSADHHRTGQAGCEASASKASRAAASGSTNSRPSRWALPEL
jgi:hypothetical protein